MFLPRISQKLKDKSFTVLDYFCCILWDFCIVSVLLFQVKGNLILITADVEDTMAKILPLKQNLFPVSLKRKMEYEGYYMHEAIDRRKLEVWHNHLRQHNPLYRDITFDFDLVDEFSESMRQLAESYEKEPPVISKA